MLILAHWGEVHDLGKHTELNTTIITLLLRSIMTYL